MSDDKRSMQKMWQDYLFLSKELHKFTSADDIEMFQSLLDQREVLFSSIKNTTDEDGYIKSDEGQKLIKEIFNLDGQLQEKVTLERNMLKQNMKVSTAYDGFFGDSMVVGNRFDSGGK